MFARLALANSDKARHVASCVRADAKNSVGISTIFEGKAIPLPQKLL
jgi:hypothetical protein